DVEKVRQLQRPAPVSDAGWNLEAGSTVAVAEQQLHQGSFSRRALASVIKSDFERTDAVPPIRLALMDMPRLCNTRVHQRMTPLPEAVEKGIAGPYHFAEKTALIRVRRQ